MIKNSIQIQSVLYGNDKDSIKRALTNIANAVRVNRNSDIKSEGIIVYYGDATETPMYTENEIEDLKSEFKDYFEFKYRFFNENTGSAKGQTLLGMESESEYVLVMNPDVIICPRFIEKILSPFVNDKNNSVCMAEARQTPIEHSKEYNRTTFETEWATGACTLIKTEDFKAINGFDYKTFFLYYDDVDISWRLRLFTGKKIIYVPDCVVYHAKNLSIKGKWLPTGAEVYYTAEAVLLMAYKWNFDKWFNKVYTGYKSSSDKLLRKAAAHFDELKKKNELPERLDKEHKVSKMFGTFYTKHRFII